MRGLLARIYYGKYPQRPWARAISRALRTLPLTSASTVVDAPCGDGILSYWLSRRHRLPFQLLDLSEEALRPVRRFLRDPRVTVARGDLRELEVAGRGDDVWLLANSLYLLPEVDRIVLRLRPRMRWIVGIFPDIDDANYLAFMKRHPDFGNENAMGREETRAFFVRHGYHVRLEEELTRFRYHLLPSRHLVRPLSPVLSLLEGRLGGDRRGAYWLSLMERNEEPHGE